MALLSLLVTKWPQENNSFQGRVGTFQNIATILEIQYKLKHDIVSKGLIVLKQHFDSQIQRWK
jgi:hypothetical protein